MEKFEGHSKEVDCFQDIRIHLQNTPYSCFFTRARLRKTFHANAADCIDYRKVGLIYSCKQY